MVVSLLACVVHLVLVRMSDAVDLGKGERAGLRRRLNDGDGNKGQSEAAMGSGRAWRRRLVHTLQFEPSDRVLDVATGTADVAILVGQQMKSRENDTKRDGPCVIGVDPSANMLAVGRDKVSRAFLNDTVSLELGDALALQYEDSSFDKISISFGIRNVPAASRITALEEFHRVIKKEQGKRLAILEISEPAGTGLLARLARWFIRLNALVGAWLSGRRREYRHLLDSIQAFPKQDDFCYMIDKAGFTVLGVETMGFGTVKIFVAEPKATR
mmetsp:Transcript_16821/g.47911  ORF Transcript_16821/g.47911 Transcript_16821/m.47911 type:complete len:271 (-) Transcript_16821:982-1794(-)